MLNAFLVALQFLTRLPVGRADWNPRDVGRSLIAYPLIGLLIGGLVAGLAWLLSGAPSAVAAAIVLGAWVALTGALHLDGLADSADAWVGGLGDRERTLEIMKDPRRGAMALVVVAVVLIAKFAALQALLDAHRWMAIACAPVLGRAAAQALLLTTRYVRSGGIGEALAANLPRNAVAVSLAVTLIAVLAAAPFQSAAMSASAAGIWWTLRRMMVRRMGGTTGDTTGATIELTETAALVAAACV